MKAYWIYPFTVYSLLYKVRFTLYTKKCTEMYVTLYRILFTLNVKNETLNIKSIIKNLYSEYNKQTCSRWF